MLWKSFRFALLASAVVATGAFALRAQDVKPMGKDGEKIEAPKSDVKPGDGVKPGPITPPGQVPAPPGQVPSPAPAPVEALAPQGISSVPVAAAPAPYVPQTQRVTVTEYVPESYVATRTSYRTEEVQEAYTAYKTESVPEVRTRNVTTWKTIHEYKDEVRCVTKCVPVTEHRTVMKQVWTTVPVTVMKTRMVDHGHYECQLVPETPGLLDRFKGLCGKKNECEPECPKMTTKKVWVANKVCEEYPVTTCEKKCELVPHTECVTVNKQITTHETVKVCVPKCVPETHCETYTVVTCRTVPYQAFRTIQKCVPYTENYTATRLVARQKEVEITVEPTCQTTCDSCSSSTVLYSAPVETKKHAGKLTGLFGGKSCNCGK